MDKRVILAVAGSGKTYYICNNINENSRNIIIAYTNQNIKNIINELTKKYGHIPDNTLVMTFHSFIYKFMIRPFDNAIGEFYGVSNFVSKGVSIISPPVPSIKLPDGNYRKNHNYFPISTLNHFHKEHKYYSDYLSKLILRVKNRKLSLINMACNNLNKFFDYIYIDEMQDFREDNWKLLLEIIKRVNNILLVGDYNQHSVSALNNHGIPFQVGKKYIGYENYKVNLSKLGLNVDETSLLKSRRCSKEICEFIQKKLNINIESNEINFGHIIYLDDETEIIKILNNDKVMKLVWEKPENYSFVSNSWSYSKGDTYENTCIILTDKYDNLDKDNFSMPNSVISVNKLYVALTRSKGNVYIIKKAIFDSLNIKIENEQIIF